MAQMSSMTQVERFKVKGGEDPRAAVVAALTSVVNALPAPDSGRSARATLSASCQVVTFGEPGSGAEFEAVATIGY